MIPQLRLLLENLFSQLGLNAEHSTSFSQITVVVALLLVSLAFAWALSRYLIPVVLKIVEKTETKWDDYLINQPVLRAVCRLLPSVLVYSLLPLCFDTDTGFTFTLLYRLTQAYIALTVTTLIGAFLRNFTTVASDVLQKHHLVGFFQFLRVLNITLCVIVIGSLLLGYNPARVIAGLGAAATVLTLVFKDTILGLVAGIQLSANKMLKVGDWVTLPKLGINGLVEEMSLTTVKVRNFDNTISTVPPYTLVSDSFQNWDGMFSRGKRRVKRALYIDARSVRFTTDNELDQLLRKKYITKEEHNAEHITNLTLFRHFITRTLSNDAQVSNEAWLLARQLEPTPHGLPLEVWFYITDTEFVRFEEKASTLMEQFIAYMPLFGLRPFQSPTGYDLSELAK